jgi:hypothetical protein
MLACLQVQVQYAGQLQFIELLPGLAASFSQDGLLKVLPTLEVGCCVVESFGISFFFATSFLVGCVSQLVLCSGNINHATSCILFVGMCCDGTSKSCTG